MTPDARNQPARNAPTAHDATAGATRRIAVRLFGPQKHAAGQSEVVLHVPAEQATAEAVLQRLAEAEPALAETARASRLAVNHEFVAGDHILKEGDEVALIGLVSGG